MGMPEAPKLPRTGSELAHVGDPTPPSGFLQFWSGLAERLWGPTCTFQELTQRTAAEREGGAKGITHTVTSCDSVRVGVRIIPPASGKPRGVVITLHGYSVDPELAFPATSAWVNHGLTTIALRVRGYPGSRFDTGDLCSDNRGYAGQHLDHPFKWNIAGAVTDVVATFRAAREMFGDAMPISLHGDSFGGGLATIAASAISMRDGLYRLAIGVPTLGHWTWRLKQEPTPGSLGHQVKRAMEARPDQHDTMLQTLRLYDAVVHARRVTCPVVCKLAIRDPIVPPMSAAAIFNALASGPGLKWRYSVEYGHTPATNPETRADVRRHAEYEMLIGEFLDPAEYPQEIMRRWEARLGERNVP